MLKRFAFGFVALVSSWGAFVACSSSSSPATPTGSCAQLAVCCLGLPALDQSVCSSFAQDNNGALCTSQLSTYTASGECGGVTPIGTGTGSGTGGLDTTSCASLTACCAEMAAPEACDAVATQGVQTTCATTLQTDEAAGLCKPPIGTGPGSGTGTGSGTGSGSCVAGGGACATFSDCCSGTCANQICNSCAASGSSCAGGEGCCTGLTCYNGTCGSCTSDGSTCTLASDCCSNICNAGVCQTCASAGSTCASTADCCSGGTCANGACCNAVGGSCSTDGDCCGGATCTSGVCSLLAPGATCTTSSQCGGGLPCTMWSPDGTTNYEQCCILPPSTAHCTTDADCCASADGLTCGSNGECQVPVGNYCTSTAECAGGYPCTTDGTIMACGDASGSTCSTAATCLIGACNGGLCCSEVQGACVTNADCCGGVACTTDGAFAGCGAPSGTACTTAATCFIGACNGGLCCAAAGGQCVTNTDCCSGATCTGATSTTAGTCS